MLQNTFQPFFRPLWSSPQSEANQIAAGLRFGDKGAMTSRTIMLAELFELFALLPEHASREDYAGAIIEDNALGKNTAATRRGTNQRLGELYGFDRAIPIFRILRRLWDADKPGRPLLALLCALGRDPLLRATATTVILLAPGAELLRTNLLASIKTMTGDRLNDATLDKVARNAASSWSQSGHLAGRVRKIRQTVSPTPGSTAFAIWLGYTQGLAGEDLLKSTWAVVLDRSPALLDNALRAKQLGLIDVRAGGQVIEIDAGRLDPVR